MGKRELLVSLASIVCAATVSAQSRQITGTIVSENGEPVVGASIVVVGTKTGTLIFPSLRISSQRFICVTKNWTSVLR